MSVGIGIENGEKKDMICGSVVASALVSRYDGTLRGALSFAVTAWSAFIAVLYLAPRLAVGYCYGQLEDAE